MRTWTVIGLSAVLGVLVGLGAAWMRLERSQKFPDPLREGKNFSKLASLTGRPEPAGPKVVLDSEAYDFGVMDEASEGSHDFLFTNEGTAPLTLDQGETTCGCTVSALEKSTIQPGESGKVTVTWRLKDKMGGFQQGVTITTNDPNWPQVGLSITGRVTTAVRAVPSELVLSRVTAGSTASGSVRLYGYLPKRLEITGQKCSDPSIEDYFHVSWEPMDEADVRKEPDATNGYLAKVTVEPGLPPGPFRQTISFQTNLEENPVINVEVKGSIGSHISVVGPGWNEETGVVNIGTVTSRQGAERTLLLVARGEHHKEVQFKLAEVAPEWLEVDGEALGQTSEVSGGTASQAVLKFRIPPGTVPSNHLGSQQGKLGRITIETNDPVVPRMIVYLRFAVVE